MSKRIGKFKVSRIAYRERPGITKDLFKWLEFLPYRVELLYLEDAFECIGESIRFDDIEEGLVAPEYRFHYDGKKWHRE